MIQWPFADPQNVAVFTRKSVMDRSDWIADVTHEVEDGAWQFHPARAVAPDWSDALLVSDPTLCAQPSV